MPPSRCAGTLRAPPRFMETRRVLVAFITRSGYTRLVAKAIAQRLRGAGLEVDVADLELCTRHPERYDAIVLGGAVHHGHHSEALATWIEENREALDERLTALVSIERGDHTPALFAHTHWRPTRVLVLTAVHEPLVRRLMRELRDQAAPAAPTLDWSKISAFVEELVPLIRAAPRRADFRVLPFGWPTRKVGVAS
ncbi:MAG: hypothetical protein JNL83_08435 [Myxococcales bacterium]|nr:hypothetical protein [Myxococcales bacterium]